MLDILYQDDYLVAVDKPPGILVHKSWIDKQATTFVMQQLRDQIRQSVYTLHRLDKKTSGVLLFGLSSAVAASMSQKIRERQLQKTYLAIVRGFTPDADTINYPLVRDLEQGPDEKVEAITRYKTLKTGVLNVPIGRYETARYSLVQAFPETGRMHQIRRHFKHLRHPIIGDTKYGDRDHNRYFREEQEMDQLFLMAQTLGFVHPVSGEQVQIEAPIRADFMRFFELVGWPPSSLD
ncbi:MAG: pseudouridine synthase [Bacteroidota bacterium]